MKSFQIRQAKKADALTIARFNQNMAWETESKKLADELIIPGVQAVLDDPLKGRYYVAEQDGAVIGQLMITYEWSDWRNQTIWWIQSVYVNENSRGNGVYKALYEAVKNDASSAGVKTIRLYVEKENQVAKTVYRKLGMHETVYDLYEVILP
ncbi:MAG: GNAT family N-acetyltransferase [Bacteroidota bacterium]|nr:GNAT family N-acetyltransferase [Bacteroidota bacterium]MDX5430445.1 GNAT family N-acetyltransferase [Bacteroidota bacterium]MDX5469204.1 GNAT family N-acetyltransferase [Bacteroidota bacterium]